MTAIGQPASLNDGDLMFSAPLYNRPVYRRLLQAFQIFSKHNQRKVREQAFTIYAGDILDAANVSTLPPIRTFDALLHKAGLGSVNGSPTP